MYDNHILRLIDRGNIEVWVFTDDHIVLSTAAVVASKPHLVPRVARDLSSRIIHGSNAASGQFPHQVALLRDGSFSCGGSVIANNWVITAAHCTEGA